MDRRYFIGILVATLIAAPASAQQNPSDVIKRQLDAFSSDDFEEAFEFASPDLQRIFATWQNFRAMVLSGYPMVHRNRSVQFLNQHLDDGRYWQYVRITDMAGKAHVLEYQMQEVPQGWRISAVQFVENAGPNV